MQDIAFIFQFMLDSIRRCFVVLDGMVFSVGGLEVTLLNIIISFLVLSLITFAFWRGAKT